MKIPKEGMRAIPLIWNGAAGRLITADRVMDRATATIGQVMGTGPVTVIGQDTVTDPVTTDLATAITHPTL